MPRVRHWNLRVVPARVTVFCRAGGIKEGRERGGWRELL